LIFFISLVKIPSQGYFKKHVRHPPYKPGSPDQASPPAENLGQNLANQKVQSVVGPMFRAISENGTIGPKDAIDIEQTFLAAIRNGNKEIFVTILPEAENFLGKAVIAAAKKGDLEILRTLLRKGEISSEHCGEAVYAAAKKGNLDIIKELLDHGAITPEYRGIAVAAAAKVGNLGIIKKLLENGAIPAFYRGCAVEDAAKSQKFNVIPELLKNGAITDHNRGVAVVATARVGNLDIIKKLLDDGKISDEFTEEAIVAAAELGNLGIIKELLNKSTITPEHRGRALLSALSLGNLDIIEAFLDDGDITPEYRGWALLNAVRMGNLGIINALLEDGDIIPESLGLALFNAARIGNLDIINALMVNGAISPEYRGLALAAAAEVGNLDIINALLVDGAITTEYRGIALLHAVSISNHDIVVALLENGDIYPDVLEGAFLVASRNGDVPLLRIFLNYNPDRAFIVAAAHEAFRNRNYDTLDLLLDQLPHDDIIVADYAQRLLAIAQQNAQQRPNTVDVHADARDLKAKDALILLWAVEKSFTPQQIETNFQAFEDYFKSLPETDKNQKAKIALYGPKPQNSPFPHLLDGEFSLRNFALTGKELIARIWSYIMNQQKNPREQEICKNSMVSALSDSVEDGFLVCNQGKTHRLLIYVLQGRLEGVNIENVELPPTAQEALSFFFKVEKRMSINTWDQLKEEGEAFLRENPAVNRDTFMKELETYFTNTFPPDA